MRIEISLWRGRREEKKFNYLDNVSNELQCKFSQKTRVVKSMDRNRLYQVVDFLSDIVGGSQSTPALFHQSHCIEAQASLPVH